jgi:hypothetical protein
VVPGRTPDSPFRRIMRTAVFSVPARDDWGVEHRGKGLRSHEHNHWLCRVSGLVFSILCAQCCGCSIHHRRYYRVRQVGLQPSAAPHQNVDQNCEPLCLTSPLTRVSSGSAGLPERPVVFVGPSGKAAVSVGRDSSKVRRHEHHPSPSGIASGFNE